MTNPEISRGGEEASGLVKYPDGIDGEIMPPQSCDDEVAGLMNELSRLQSWLVLQMARSRGDRDFMAAADLIQRTRCLIVERLYSRRTPSPEKE